MMKELTFEETRRHHYSWETGFYDDDWMALSIAEDVYNAISEMMESKSYTLEDHDSLCNKVAMTLIRMTEHGKTMKSERLKFLREARRKNPQWP